ncbi:MAG: hypothetical protein H7240_05745 [Glaciimonas sp.]|nr:hypothetical protein [Glaciimonas sp.]
MHSAISASIGGYFELELPSPKSFLYRGTLGFQSARAAFFALLLEGRPTRVWMPKYICNSMLEPLVRAGVDCLFYNINAQFDIVGDVDVRPTDWLFYVNYFGVCSDNVENIFARFNQHQIVLDHSHAFYVAPKDCLATIYSPRKFFGIPDGGLLVTQLSVKTPSEIDNDSINRITHLFKRLADSPQSGYADYLQAEKSLSEFEPLEMSCLTRRMLASIDYQYIRTRRNQNFRFLHGCLGNLNQLQIKLNNVDGPLCYPFITISSEIRELLVAERVFIPSYWSDVKGRTCDDDVEAYLCDKCIAIPCDQRYEIQDLKKITQIILDWKR